MTPPGGHRPRRVVLVTREPVRPRMAGPAIRALELARVLGDRGHAVVLVSTDVSSEQAPLAVDLAVTDDPVPVATGADVVVVSGDVLAHHPGLALAGATLVADMYDPFHLEVLEQTRTLPPSRRAAEVRGALRAVDVTLDLADLVLCANEVQRALWIGHLAAGGRLTERLYDRDPTLRSIVDVVPFGVQAEPEPLGLDPLRGAHPDVGPDDDVVLWGGGLYDWLDPVTAVRAMVEVLHRRPRTKLVFLAGRHPNAHVAMPDNLARTVAAASALGLLGSSVVLHEEWVPYAERVGWLQAAAVGVSLHHDHLETTFAHRTRVLDYLWAGLPVLSTEGDQVSSSVVAAGAGLTAPADDVAAVANGLVRLLDDRETYAAAARTAAGHLRWEIVAGALARFCDDPHPAADRDAQERARRVRRARRSLRPSLARRGWFRARDWVDG